MGRTFNRAPLTVNTPSSSDVKQYFFNHYKWKGLSDDKNFLTADQETFTDCNNVYMDEEGLLKSRPSLKVATVTRSNGVTNYVLSNILNVWTFEHVTVYQTKPASEYYLTFINNRFDEHIQVNSVENVKLVVADEKIFVFSEQSFEYYDMKENTYANAEKFIHIPVTKVMTNGVLDSTVDVESPNVLTTSHIIKHLYTSANQVNFKKLVGKQVSVEVDGISYTVDFVNNNELVFVNRYSGLTESNFSDANILGIDGEGIPLVEVSESSSMIISSYTYSVDAASKRPVVVWTIYHTVDGLIFNRLPDVVGVVGKPLISKDGNYCIVFMQDGPYIYSLLKTSDVIKYPDWTNLLSYLDKETYDVWQLNFNETLEYGNTFNHSTVVNGYFINDESFAFTIGQSLAYPFGDPKYSSYDCIYGNGIGKIGRETIFSSLGQRITWRPLIASKDVPVIQFSIDEHRRYSTNLAIFEFNYDGYIGDDDFYADGTYSKFADPIYENEINIVNGETVWGTAKLSGYIQLIDYKNNVVLSKAISFTVPNYSPVTYQHGQIVSYNKLVFEDELFIYTIASEPNGSNSYTESLTIVAKQTFTRDFEFGEKVPVNFDNNTYLALTANSTPNVYANYDYIAKTTSIAIDFVATLLNIPSNKSPYYRATKYIEISDNTVTANQFLDYESDIRDTDVRSPLKDSILINANRYTSAKYDTYLRNVISIHTIVFSTASKLLENAEINTTVEISTALSSAGKYSKIIKLSDPSCYLVTNFEMFPYSDYTDDTKTYEPIPLLFEATPVGYYYSGNSNDSLYLATDDTLYASNVDEVITVTELIEGETNYLLPSFVALLSNYYFAKDNHLYISSPSVQFDVASDGTVKRTANDFKWYIPEISKQDFDFEITNLHVISNTDVAIFFEHSVSYVSWDSSVSAYRYYKSKLQTGCKQGCDVITSYDGKYVIFASERGLVAMTYQEFTATTEQALTYLSDPIHAIFERYLAKNIKLFKYSYWIFVYKQDSKEFYLLDIRNNSWWPLTSLNGITKIVMQNDKPFFLMNRRMFNFSKNETDYYDYDDTAHKIEWFVKSQKLYLNAVNYYKHIVNMTFVSVHDKELLQNANYNVDALDFKLQVTNYRKTVNGNIGNDDEYTTVNYTVESARTYVQRLNYSKVNEFQYMLSSNEQNAINIPLSLSGITVKYKISNQVR